MGIFIGGYDARVTNGMKLWVLKYCLILVMINYMKNKHKCRNVLFAPCNCIKVTIK